MRSLFLVRGTIGVIAMLGMRVTSAAAQTPPVNRAAADSAESAPNADGTATQRASSVVVKAASAAAVVAGGAWEVRSLLAAHRHAGFVGAVPGYLGAGSTSDIFRWALATSPSSLMFSDAAAADAPASVEVLPLDALVAGVWETLLDLSAGGARSPIFAFNDAAVSMASLSVETPPSVFAEALGSDSHGLGGEVPVLGEDGHLEDGHLLVPTGPAAHAPNSGNLVSTPEPGSMALLATGLIGLGAKIRRRRNRAL
jgi:hypothetical protein